MKKQKHYVRKIKRKVLSLLLIVALVTTGINLNMMSQFIYAAQERAKESKRIEEKVTVVKELVDERTENSNTYLLSNGSKKLEIYGENVRYENEGELIDYDSSLTTLSNIDRKELKNIRKEHQNAYVKVNKQGDSKQYFPEEIRNDTPVILKKEGDTISFCPELGKDEKVAMDETEENKLTYTTEDRRVEYIYTSLNNGVKEDIVINEETENNRFSFQLDLNGLEPAYDKTTGRIYLLEEKNVKAYIEAPNIIDASGNILYKEVKYELMKEDNGYRLEVIVDKNYLKEAEYPITVDPSVVWKLGKMKTALVNSMQYIANSNLHGDIFSIENKCNTRPPYEGSEQRAYIYFELDAPYFETSHRNINQAYVEQAHLCFRENDTSFMPATVEVRNPEEKWNDTTITWNNQPSMSEKVWGEVKCTGVNKTMQAIDITEWAQGIVSGSIENTGLVLTAKEEGTGVRIYGNTDEYGETVLDKYWTSYGMSLDITYSELQGYDGTVSMEAEYNDEEKTIEVKLSESEDDTGSNDNIRGIKLFKREAKEKCFSYITTDTTVSNTLSLPVKDIEDTVDLRLCVSYADGTAKVTNIVSFGRMAETSKDENGNDVTTVTYEQTTIDTDGDGLEDGYEIWDLKTLWNKVTGVDEEGNKIYDLDTDKDGFPDSYEVFTLGTDPAVANEEGKDSDGDGWTDIKEYQEGTDPYLKDSDFDGTNDNGDKNPRKTSGHTNPAKAAAAKVHKGLFDREYSETEDGVTTTYITNIYRGNIRQIEMDYGSTTLNKTMKYFYDEKGNNTAIIEEYDKAYDPNGEQTICITYTYDADRNVTFICDQSTKYTMTYENGEMSELKVGNDKLIQYGKRVVENHVGTEGDISGIQDGGVIDKKENVTSYGNNQSIKTVTTTFKRAEGNLTEAAAEDKIYYNASENASYVIEYNNEGKILKLTDSTGSSGEVVYTYTYQDNVAKVVRSDGFTKEVTTSENEDGSVSTTKTEYTFKNLKSSNTTYISVYKTDNSDESKSVASNTLFNNDKFTTETSNEGKNAISTLYSDSYKKNILKMTEKEVSNTKTTFDVDIYAEDKAFEYTYDLAGNITSIKESGQTLYEYTYDAHGRLTGQKDFSTNECHEYIYNTTGNIHADWKYPLDGNGNKISVQGSVKYSEYENVQWPDQVTSYNGNSISYDGIGNPLEYWNGMVFEWTSGRQLEKIVLDNGLEVRYKYNKDGLRTHKETEKISTDYEWDDNRLIRETVTYKATGKKYDVWYFFDANNQVAGFEYSEISGMDNSLKKTRVYYEKNLQGDVIGLLDSRGAEIAKYSYDAWGNVTGKMCYEGYEMPYHLNHITYRGYYRDDESGFYYLQSRYYDAGIGRFLNADDVFILTIEGKDIYKDNMYIYCNSNPIKMIDKDGKTPGRRKYKFTYNRNKVKNYIDKHWYVKPQSMLWGLISWCEGMDYRYVYFKKGDCANFVSQCLVAGGIPMTSKWYFRKLNRVSYTPEWSAVKNHQKYIIQNITERLTIINSGSNLKKEIKTFNLRKGDVMYFNSGRGYTHATIISKVTDNMIYYAGHSNNRYMEKITNFLNENNHFVKICRIKDKGVIYD